MFKIGAAEEQIGSVTKQYGGFIQEIFTTADNFLVTFPKGLDPRMKATLIATSILIVFTFISNPLH